MRAPSGTPPASVASPATAPAGEPAGGSPADPGVARGSAIARQARRAIDGPLGRFARFAAVGASGVVVNAAVLLLLVEGLRWPVLGASLLSIELSTLSNWALNRHWTWRDRDDTAWHSLAKYHGIAAVGMAIQWLVLAGLLATTDAHYLAGTVLGVAAATAWNFAGNHVFAFRDRDAPPVPRWAVYATSAFIQLVLAAVFAHPWDTFVFQRSVEDLLLRGLTPYEVAEQAPSYTYWGGQLPALPMWYAYPPLPLALMVATYFPSALGWIPWDWTGRLLIRLPFIAATLGLAAAARHLVATAPGARPGTPAKADRAERLLLLNPLFLAIAALWGQFEALVLLLLLASVLAVRQARHARAGAWWALAVCVKIFPLYLVPLLAIHLHRTGGRRAVLRFAGAAAAVGAAINLPVLLWSPRGYLQQVLLMHGARDPARLAPLNYIENLLELLSKAWPDHLPAPEAWSGWLNTVSLVLVATVVLAIAAASRRKPANEGRLLEWMALTFLGGLLATKVLNEQYLLLPLGLLLVARAHPQRTMPRGVGRFVTLGSWAVVTAGLLGGLSILYYVPAPLAKSVFGGLAPETVGRVANALGLTASQLRSLLRWGTGLFLLVPALAALRRLHAPVAEGLLALERALLRRLRALGRIPGRIPAARPSRPALLLGAIALLCTAPLGVALAGGLSGPASSQPLANGGPWALAEITTSWYNPTNDVDRAEGTWDGVAVRPQPGYYTVNAHKAELDIGLAQRAGFDGLVIEVHPYYGGAAAAVRRVAEAEGMPYALGIDLAAVHPGVALEAASARQLRARLDAPTLDYWQGRHHIVAPDGQAKVVFLSGVTALQPAFTPAELRFVRDAWLATSPPPADTALLQTLTPATLDDLAGSSDAAALWRAAYAQATVAWWHLALDTQQRIAVLSDAPLPAGTPQWLGPRDAAEPRDFEARATGATAAIRFTTLRGILAPDQVRPGWEKAAWTEADGVVVPWNDYLAGSAVEPTQAHGLATLVETARAIATFKRPPVDAGVQAPQDTGAVEQAVEDLLPRKGKAPLPARHAA